MKLAIENYCYLIKGYFCREPLNPVEVWQVLEPDELVMQIGLGGVWGGLIMKPL